MPKVLQWMIAAVLIAGGLVVWGLVPQSWIGRVPAFGRMVLAVCAIAFVLFTALGVVLDSGLLRRIFKRRQP